ncbi:MAG: hypothetical protein LBI10_02585 [Deltaproteobacteria bacterium]|jgi:hypothetical protein|nr:hypothetical protein [Deltaproteobacteria bacterium]
MRYSLNLSEQTLEVLNYFKNDNTTISDDSVELFDIATKFYYQYHIKNIRQFITNPHFFVYFDRLIVHTSTRLEKLYPGFLSTLNQGDLGYLEKLEIIKNFLKDKLSISIDILQK